MEMPKLPLEKRKTTFEEVETGFTNEQALEEANRCAQCKTPSCLAGCPAEINIPEFIKAFREGKLAEAGKILREKNFFPSICGRICQHEKQCEAACIFAKKGDPVKIGGIERYIGDNTTPPKNEKLNGKKVAIIGSGPSGLTAAAYLSLAGVNVTVLESTHAFGGIIKYGVPEFRLPKDIVRKELKALQELGIDFEPNAKIEKDSLKEISKKYDAVFIGTGVGKSRKLKVKGSDLKGVHSAMKFLVNFNQSDLSSVKKGEKVVVIGAGYVGIDAARSAIRLGADVTCLTNESREKALSRIAEKDLIEAEEEGAKFIFGAKIEELVGKDSVEKVHYVETNGTEVLEANTVIFAIGQEHDSDSIREPLRTEKDGAIKVNGNHQTQIKNVFAAGDCVHGPKTVVEAVARGRETAEAIITYLKTNGNRK